MDGSEWICEHRESRVFSARPNPVTDEPATLRCSFMSRIPSVSGIWPKTATVRSSATAGWPMNRSAIRRRSLGTTDWEQAKSLAAQWLKWGQLMEPLKRPCRLSEKVSIEHAIERFLKSKGPEGENIDQATLRKYEVLLKDRLVPWCRARRGHIRKAAGVQANVRGFCAIVAQSESRPEQTERQVVGKTSCPHHEGGRIRTTTLFPQLLRQIRNG